MKSFAILGLTGLILCALAGVFLLNVTPQTVKRTVLPGPPYFTRFIDGQTDL